MFGVFSWEHSPPLKIDIDHLNVSFLLFWVVKRPKNSSKVNFSFDFRFYGFAFLVYTCLFSHFDVFFITKTISFLFVLKWQNYL